MLVATQVKLSERRSLEKVYQCNTCSNSVVIRPCTQNNVTGGQPRITHVHPVPARRHPNLRVVSLNLDNVHNSITRSRNRSPRRMPLYCVHHKRLQKIYHRDDDKGFRDEFLVRGTEVGTGNAVSDNESESCVSLTETQVFDDGCANDLNSLSGGIQIQLTDCCQCVCDLFNSNFDTANDDDHDFSFISKEKSHRDKEVLSLQRTFIDPSILKVIRITMSSKN